MERFEAHVDVSKVQAVNSKIQIIYQNVRVAGLKALVVWLKVQIDRLKAHVDISEVQTAGSKVQTFGLDARVAALKPRQFKG